MAHGGRRPFLRERRRPATIAAVNPREDVLKDAALDAEKFLAEAEFEASAAA